MIARTSREPPHAVRDRLGGAHPRADRIPHPVDRSSPGAPSSTSSARRRSAVYGVTGFAGGPIGRLREALGLGQPGIVVTFGVPPAAGKADLSIDLDLTVAYGLPIAEVARQVDSAVRYSIRNALGREVDPADDPRRRPPLPARRPARHAAARPERRDPGRPRGERDGRRLMAGRGDGA